VTGEYLLDTFVHLKSTPYGTRLDTCNRRQWIQLHQKKKD